MQKKNLATLALFIGAECRLKSPINNNFLSGKTIVGVSDQGVYVNKIHCPHDADTIIPYLREFSDLTDAEATELLVLRTGTDLSNFNVVVTKQEHMWIIAAYEKEHNQDDEMDCVELTHYNPSPKQVYTAAEVMFFVTRYFDIFQFIQTGQAIAKAISTD